MISQTIDQWGSNMVGTSLSRLAAMVFVSLMAIGEVLAHDAMFVEQGGTRMLKLGAPATDIIVADPSIVDVSVQSQSQLVLIGKKYGTTQVMILSGDQVVLDSRVVVTTANQNSTISVFSPSGRGVTERSYACYTRCATAQTASSGSGSTGQTISVTLGEGGVAAAAPAPAAPAQSGETTTAQ